MDTTHKSQPKQSGGLGSARVVPGKGGTLNSERQSDGSGLAQKHSEALFRGLFELSPDAIVLIDPHNPHISWPIVDCNARACQMSGYSREELIGQSIDVLNGNTATPAERDAYLKRLRREGGFKLETQHRHKNGSMFPIEISTTLIQVGESELVMGIDRDITERKQAEEALREEKLHLTSIFSTVEDIISFLAVEPGEKYRFISINPAFFKISGLQKDQVVGRLLNEVAPEPSLGLALAKFRQAIQEKSMVRWEESFDYPTGQLFGEVTIAPVMDDAGKCTHLVGAVHNITERKRAEKVLQVRMEQLLAINQVSQSVTDFLDIDQLLADVIALADKVAGSDYTSIVLVDEKGVINKTVENIPGKLSIEKRIRREGFTAWILRTRQPVVVDEIGEDGTVQPEIGGDAPHTANPELFLPHGIKSFAGLPLVTKDHVVGVLYLHSLKTATYHSQLTLLTTIANQAAVAIENARLYEKAQAELAERERAEQSLEQERNLLRSLIDTVPDFIYAKDTEARIIQANQACARGSGVPRPEDTLGKTDFDFFPQELAAGYYADDMDVIRSGRPLLQREEQFVSATGDLRWLSTNKVPLKDDQGRIYGLVGSGRDVTARKQAEAELKASREAERIFSERLTLLSEITTELSKAENLDMLCRRAVELGCERLGFDRFTIWFLSPDHTSMQGTYGVDDQGRYTDERTDRHPLSPSAHVWPVVQGDVPLMHLKDKNLYLNGKVVGQGAQVCAGLWDGRSVTGYISVDNLLRQKPFSDQDCEIIRLFASAMGHLCTLQRAQEELRAGEERYRMLFELSPDAVAVYQAGIIAFVNQAAVKLLRGNNPADIIGKPVMDFVHPDYRQVVVERARQQHVERRTVPVIEEKFLRLDGSAVDVDVTAAPVTYQNKVASMVIFRDITERKQAAEALERQDKELRQRNEELARLYRASGSLISESSLNLLEQARKIVEIVQREFGQAYCSLLVLQKETGDLTDLVVSGQYANQVRFDKLTLDGPGLIPLAMRTNKVINVGDVHSAPEYLQGWDAAQSEMVVPLSIGNEMIGAIDLESVEPNSFNSDDERLMTIFAERAALALEHSLLYGQIEARMQQLTALRTIDMAISSSSDINLTLGILLDQLKTQLGAHAFDVLVFNPVTQTLQFFCGQGFRAQTHQYVRLRLGEGLAGKAALERQILKVHDLRTDLPGLKRTTQAMGENFSGYVGVPLIAKGQIKGVLEVFHREPLKLTSDQQAFLEATASQAGIAIDNSELFEHLQNSIADLKVAYDSTLEGWASALELRDKETEGHTRRVTDQTTRLAQVMGVKDEDLVHIYRGALLHDIGKIGVPDRIVLKTGPLTDDEWQVMRKHPTYAYKMLSPISYLREALNIPYCHHERWDGSGYPRGLKGEEIPLAARIFSVVDVWDALTSDRPYRKAWTHEQARAYLQEQAGKQFDPGIVAIFFKEEINI
jgi:PAS domain S-box-containing protein